MAAKRRSGVSPRLRFEVLKRDGFTCVYCGAKAPDVPLHADHVKPVAEGGLEVLDNLVTACAKCNRGKGPVLLSVIAARPEVPEDVDRAVAEEVERLAVVGRVVETYNSQALEGRRWLTDAAVQQIDRFSRRLTEDEMIACVFGAIRRVPPAHTARRFRNFVGRCRALARE